MDIHASLPKELFPFLSSYLSPLFFFFFIIFNFFVKEH